MSKKVFEIYDGDQVTDSMVQEASQLFSENYGTWAKEAATMLGAFTKEGSQVKLSKNRLRDQYLPKGAATSYARVTVDGHLAGNGFACRWKHNNKSVCCVTQLVVHRDYRERGLATGLLNELRKDTDDIYGLMSSHPAACVAAVKAFAGTMNKVKLNFIRDHAEGIMATPPINYIKDAKLRGRLFKSDDLSSIVSCVDTKFFDDHAEPLEALALVRESMDWPLGELTDGHEFLLIFEARRRARSRSRS